MIQGSKRSTKRTKSKKSQKARKAKEEGNRCAMVLCTLLAVIATMQCSMFLPLGHSFIQPDWYLSWAQFSHACSIIFCIVGLALTVDPWAWHLLFEEGVIFLLPVAYLFTYMILPDNTYSTDLVMNFTSSDLKGTRLNQTLLKQTLLNQTWLDNNVHEGMKLFYL